MAFDNLSEFMAMGGYGEYVWLAYGVSSLVWLALGIYLMSLKHHLKHRLSGQIKLEKALKRSAS